MAIDFVVCLQKDNLGDISGDDLHLGRLYEVVEQDAGHGMIRIIDESGEDFVYPQRCFASVSMQESIVNRLHQVLPRG